MPGGRPKGHRMSEESKQLIREKTLARWARIRKLLDVPDMTIATLEQTFEEPEPESAESA